jgi:hypothetical protein
MIMTLDDDAELVWLEPEQLPKPSAKTGTTQETTVQTIEQHLMLLSNSELKEECRRRNLSASGNKTALVQRLLTLIEPLLLLLDLPFLLLLSKMTMHQPWEKVAIHLLLEK